MLVFVPSFTYFILYGNISLISWYGPCKVVTVYVSLCSDLNLSQDLRVLYNYITVQYSETCLQGKPQSHRESVPICHPVIRGHFLRMASYLPHGSCDEGTPVMWGHILHDDVEVSLEDRYYCSPISYIMWCVVKWLIQWSMEQNQ